MAQNIRLQDLKDGLIDVSGIYKINDKDNTMTKGFKSLKELYPMDMLFLSAEPIQTYDQRLGGYNGEIEGYKVRFLNELTNRTEEIQVADEVPSMINKYDKIDFANCIMSERIVVTGNSLQYAKKTLERRILATCVVKADASSTKFETKTPATNTGNKDTKI